MIYSELKYNLFWLSIFCIGIIILNVIYSKTIFFCLILYKNKILEFSYENGLSLLNLELVIFTYVLMIQLFLISFLLILGFIVSGLFYFEIKIFFKFIILFIFIFIFYYLIIYNLIEKFIFYSNINSSSNIILINLDVVKFISYKFKFHVIILFSFIVSYFLLVRFYFFIIILILKKEFLLILIFITALNLLKNFHVKVTI